MGTGSKNNELNIQTSPGGGVGGDDGGFLTFMLLLLAERLSAEEKTSYGVSSCTHQQKSDIR